ncbi:helix-turn-helix domain-containing protein [Methylobacter psychrophilus]|uniref:helix-turn-helix domain-containing protein n=1 Tax=Methylobacter psychrophilus TaxID=96941 RepID=UPI00374E0E38
MKEQLSKISGVSTSFILNLFNGKGNPSLQIIERIADALDKPLAGLLKEIHLDSKSFETIAGSKPHRNSRKRNKSTKARKQYSALNKFSLYIILIFYLSRYIV